jgi:uncharacterized lipoprotein YmbA
VISNRTPSPNILRHPRPRYSPVRAAGALLALTVACGIAGCATSLPFHYYTLLDTTPAGNTVPAAGSAGKPVLIAVQPPTLPTQVTRPQLVLTEAGGRIAIREQQRWSQPLEAEIQQALSQDLTRVLPAIDVARTMHADKQPVYRIGLDVQRFEITAHGGVRLEAVWSVAGSAGGTPAVCRDVQRQAAAQETGAGAAGAVLVTDYAALVEAQRLALQRVAQHIAAAIRAMQDARTVGCP